MAEYNQRLFLTENQVSFNFSSQYSGPAVFKLNMDMYCTYDVNEAPKHIEIELSVPFHDVVDEQYLYKVNLTDLFQGLRGYVGCVNSCVAEFLDFEGEVEETITIVDALSTFVGGGVSKRRFADLQQSDLVDNPTALLTSRLPHHYSNDIPSYEVYQSELAGAPVYLLLTNPALYRILTYGPTLYFSPVESSMLCSSTSFPNTGGCELEEYVDNQWLIRAWISIVKDPDCEQKHLITFVNSYGVKESVLIWGEAEYAPEFTEAESVIQMDGLEQMRNIPAKSTIRDKMTVQTGFQSADRQTMFLDMLISPLVWLSSNGGEARRCKITCEGYKRQLVQSKPFNLTLNVDFMDEDTCVL